MDQVSRVRPRRSFAALLRAAGNIYALVIRDQLAERGFDDVPRDGAFVLTSIRYAAATPSDLTQSLGISKQAVSQLLDTLVQRDYVRRAIHPVDRRRTNFELTERGLAAAAVCREAADQVERSMTQRVGAETVSQARTALAALLNLALEWSEAA